MSFNPFKRRTQPEQAAEQATDAAAAVDDSMPQPQLDSDTTDPLGSALSQRATLLAEGNDTKLERVEVWGAERLADSFLRLTVSDEQRAGTLRKLLLELPEQTSGFRDLLVSDDAPLAAALEPTDATLAELADGKQPFRALDVLEALADTAALLAEINEHAGWVWPEPDAPQMGLRRSSSFPATGHNRLRASFLGWTGLAEGEEQQSARALAELGIPPLEALEQRASESGLSHSSTELERLTNNLREQAASVSTFRQLSQSLHELSRPRLVCRAATDTGKRRQHNEDAFALLELEQLSSTGVRFTLAAVADGMGGHNSGEIASSLALDLLRAQLSTLLLAPRTRAADPSTLVDQLAGVIPSIGRALNERAALEPALAGMGTTLAGLAALEPLSSLAENAAALPQPAAAVFWVGDSRAYLLSAAGLQPLSTDHSYVQGLVQSGQIDASEAFSHPQKNIITRCLGGSGQDDRPEVASFSLGPGEIVLICSDGLSDALRDEDIWRVACEASNSMNLPVLAQALIDAANAAGGPDNITVALIAS